MNNTCPSCGALYNVAQKDIGRRIKCKKCGSALTVAEAGLEAEPPGAAGEPAAAQEEVETAPHKVKAKRATAGPGIDFVQLFNDLGGVATLFFGFGAFLVIVFLFMPIIGSAANERAGAARDKLEQERDAKIKRLIPGSKRLEELTTDERKKYDEDAEKIRKDYEKRIGDAADDARAEVTSNKRSKWMELYGMLLGFVFLMAGSIGYMTPGQSQVRRILGTVVLGAQMLIVFVIFAAGGCGKGPVG